MIKVSRSKHGLMALVSMGARPNGSTTKGVVVRTHGRALLDFIDEVGSNQCEDLGLDDAPAGLSIWEGRIVSPGGPDHDRAEAELSGAFRAQKEWTEDEWRWMRAHGHPWDAANPYADLVETFRCVATEEFESRDKLEDAREEFIETMGHPCEGIQVLDAEVLRNLIAELEPVFAHAKTGALVESMRLKRDALDYAPLQDAQLRLFAGSGKEGVTTVSTAILVAMAKELIRARAVLK